MIHTRRRLEGRDLELGVGLAEFMLILLPVPTSGTELILRPMPELTTLLRLAVFFAGTAAGFGGGGGALSIIVIAAGLTNIPLPGSQSK